MRRSDDLFPVGIVIGTVTIVFVVVLVIGWLFA
jgi:hypothetical protein